MPSFIGTGANESILPGFVSATVLRVPVGALPTAAADFIDAGGGDDTINGGGGADVVLAGAGNDYVYAGLGLETLDGGTGVDWLNTTSWSGAYVINMATGATNFAGESFVNFENRVSGK